MSVSSRMNARRRMTERLATGLIAGAVAFGLACAVGPKPAESVLPSGSTFLGTHGAVFSLRYGGPALNLASRDNATTRNVDLAIVVEEKREPIALSPGSIHSALGALVATFPVSLDEGTVEATLEVRVDPARDAATLKIAIPRGTGGATHRVALRAEMAGDAEGVFVSGVGQVAERAVVSGNALLVDLAPHPIAVASSMGAVTVETVSEETTPPGEPMRVAAASPASEASEEPTASLHVLLAESSAKVWKSLAELGGIPIAPVRGRVTGTTERARVWGRDAQGNPAVRVLTGEGGAFAFDAPTSVVQWYAAVDPKHASSLMAYVPGTGRDLVLDMSPGGDVHVTVVDGDTHAPITARLVFQGLDGSVDPNFGPDYRASGAGPLIDALHGEVTTPLPAGKYRISATKGIEWTIDAQAVEVGPGRVGDVTLALRHVVPTHGVLACDLHVHARPSFDAPVTPEDRVLSLAAAGIDFAVPTEHNAIGDYTSAIETLGLGKQFSSLPGVEVTTYNLGFGHFGVFPFAPGTPLPPYKHTTMQAVFRAVRSDPGRYFQLNHPRLPGGIGYFNNIGFDPQGPRTRISNRIDFDGIEVYNGFDIRQPERVDQVLRDYWALLDYGWRYTATGSSDSHRIEYQWAGYPRTMIALAPDAPATFDTQPVDPMTVVAALKKGHVTVTSGPLIEFVLAGVRPGDDALTAQDPLHGHLRIRAAPWVDVTSAEIVVGQIEGGWKVAQTFDVPSRPTSIGTEPGTLDEAEARTIRFDRDIEVSVGPGNGWVVVVVRAKRPMSDVLPFVPVTPFGFTDPVYVVRQKMVPPPFPGGISATR
jgi:hypothetical protein